MPQTGKHKDKRHPKVRLEQEDHLNTLIFWLLWLGQKSKREQQQLEGFDPDIEHKSVVHLRSCQTVYDLCLDCSRCKTKEPKNVFAGRAQTAKKICDAFDHIGGKKMYAA
jgi:hypothetical protein